MNKCDFYSVKEIQAKLGCSKNKAYAIIKSTAFPFIRFGRTYLVPKEAYHKWVEKNTGRNIMLYRYNNK